MRLVSGCAVRALVLLLAACVGLAAQPPAELHGKRPATLVVRNVHVIRGDGAPPEGPRDVYVRDGRIVAAPIERPAAEIDGTGCWLLPGLVNTHGHLQEERAGVPIEAEYQLSLWLASGITTVRDVGSTWSRSVRLRARSAAGRIAAPRLYLYRSFGPVFDVGEARRRVDAFAAAGADGIKLWSALGRPPEIVRAVLERARQRGLRVTTHIGVGGTDAIDYAENGVTSIEHFYGIPDAALPGVQHLPADFSYSDEVARFRWAGRLWREADPERLEDVLRRMVERGVAWSPTLAIYEASRDVLRARNKPWFAEYLHPGLAAFFEPAPEHHGSYFVGWTSTDEAHWAESYRIWFEALRRFEDLGGVITTGEDAGFIYVMYGFGLVRELELHQEAGFHPLEVLRHATYNGARVLGEERRFGRVLPGLAADLVVVRGNPLANLKVFYPTGCDVARDGRNVRGGGVLYTVKDGYVYHAPTLLRRVREIVARARARTKHSQESKSAQGR